MSAPVAPQNEEELERALDAPPEKARKPNGFGFDEGQMRQKLARPSGHQGRRG